jgi:hypothetical protein
MGIAALAVSVRAIKKGEVKGLSYAGLFMAVFLITLVFIPPWKLFI